MKPNKLKELWRDGRPVLNGWLSIGSPFLAEILAEQDYDAITIDLQHGMVDFTAMLGMLQAMRASRAVPLVRVPWLDPAAIMRALDAGAYGVICPMINDGRQAAELVSYTRFPPGGTRSFGPTRAAVIGGPFASATADETVLCFAMIETAAALANVDAIAATPGLDGLYIGPTDLTLGLAGRRLPHGFDREEPEIVDAIMTILRAAKRAGIKAALHCGSAAYAAKAAGWGFDLVTLPNDVRLVAAGAAANLAETRALLTDQARS